MPGDADDAVLLTKEIKGFDSLLGEADDPLRWKHPSGTDFISPRLLIAH